MTITDVLTVVNVLNVMKDLVEEYGDSYTYDDRVKSIRGWNTKEDGCEYEIEGQPACIVGMVFDRLGILEEVLNSHPKHGLDTAVGALLNPNDSVTKVLSAAQEAQDRGAPWEYAYKKSQYTAKYLGAL